MRVTDANDASIVIDARVPEINITTARDQIITGLGAQCDVIGAGGLAGKRFKTHGYVTVAGGCAQ